MNKWKGGFLASDNDDNKLTDSEREMIEDNNTD
ncbi:hypothetical protein KS4_11250 [Poriferisphaera corsica]|uniref:Uncharacterized protein n=1 Tax=Poriferisphaera corsica TaxID=2528020 RepID=A0A517YS86_9BACT|nr:hypothetical protein KS4_11250 [Poriferisphaera corsica]